MIWGCGGSQPKQTEPDGIQTNDKAMKLLADEAPPPEGREEMEVEETVELSEHERKKADDAGLAGSSTTGAPTNKAAPTEEELEAAKP